MLNEDYPPCNNPSSYGAGNETDYKNDWEKAPRLFDPDVSVEQTQLFDANYEREM